MESLGMQPKVTGPNALTPLRKHIAATAGKPELYDELEAALNNKLREDYTDNALRLEREILAIAPNDPYAKLLGLIQEYPWNFFDNPHDLRIIQSMNNAMTFTISAPAKGKKEINHRLADYIATREQKR